MSDKKYKEWLKEMEDVSKDDILEFYYNLYFKYNKQKQVLDKIKEELKPYKYDYNTILLVSFDQMKDTIKTIQRIVDEVEITEEHKIPDKIDQWNKKWNYVYYKKEILNQMKDNIEQLRQKINEIIDYLEVNNDGKR